MKSNRFRFRHSTVYKNSKGRIVKREDTMFGGTAYHLEDANGNYVPGKAYAYVIGQLENEFNSIEVNDLLWELSHDKSIDLKPYHLTRTLSY